jgi:hypothetical protein
MGVRDETDDKYNFVDAGVNLKFETKKPPQWA